MLQQDLAALVFDSPCHATEQAVDSSIIDVGRYADALAIYALICYILVL